MGHTHPELDSDESIKSTLSNIEKGIGEGNVAQQSLNQIFSNPQVMEVLRMQEAGQQVSVVSGVPGNASTHQIGQPGSVTPDVAPELDSEDLDGMSQKQFLNHMEERNAFHMKKMFQEMMSPMMDQLSGATQHIANTQQEAVNSQIAACMERHSDFNDFRQDMAEVNKKNPDLDVEELYQLCKRRRYGQTPDGLATEKPNSTTSQSNPISFEDVDTVGRKGFDNLLEHALKGKTILGAN